MVARRSPPASGGRKPAAKKAPKAPRASHEATRSAAARAAHSGHGAAEHDVLPPTKTTERDVDGVAEHPAPHRKPVAHDVVDGEVVRSSPRPPAAKRARKAAITARPADAVEPEVAEAPAITREAGEGAALLEPIDVEPAAEEFEEVEVADADAVVAAIVPAAQPTVARRDPLQAYMAEVRRHPLLTREEEIALARRFRDTGDVRAAYTLVASNLRLVVKLAHEYHRNPLALLDLVQEGNIGLMQAVKKFDPERGVKLASYAAWWIRAYILRYIMDNWKMVKLGTTEAQRKLFFKLRQEQERLTNQGFDVTPKLLAERLNVTEQDVIEMDQRLGQDELSLDAPLGRDDEGKETRADRMLSTAQPAADDALGNAELKKVFREQLGAFAATLGDKERLIFEKRLIADEPMTLQDIGTQWGVSRERARQIEAGLIDRMRKYMRANIPDFDLVAAERHD